MTEAEAFVDNWSRVWRGADSDPELCMEPLHEGCLLVNPINAIRREDLPTFIEALLQMEPDIRVVPIRWAETDDGVLIEWINAGTLHGAPIELRGVDRYTLKDGKASEGYSYFDPRPFLEGRRYRPVRTDPDERPEDGAHILSPPQEIREISGRPGIGLTATLEAHSGRRGCPNRPTSGDVLMWAA
jgi:hypothetical protein